MIEARVGTPETRTKPEVWVHAASFLPAAFLAKNEDLVRWVEQTGADKIEWIALGFAYIGPTHDVLTTPVSVLKEIFKDKLGGGHVVFNPHATVLNTLRRHEDPLRPGKPLDWYHVLLSKESLSIAALQKLQKVKEGIFSTIVYPYGEMEKHYVYPYLQTIGHPWDEKRSVDEIISEVVERGRYKKVCIDSTHIIEATASGVHPFGSNEKEIFQTIEKFHKAGVLGEAHIQTGRIIELDSTLEESADDDTREIRDGSYNSRLGRMIKFLIHDLGFMGPYTTEADPRSLVGKKWPLPPEISGLIEAQATLVDYIRRA